MWTRRSALGEQAGLPDRRPRVAAEGVQGQMGACAYAFVRDPDGNRVEFCEGSPWV